MASSVPRRIASFFLVLYYILESMVLALVPKRLRYKNISGEIVLVTGGGSGIGRLLCLRFAEHGARVVVWDLNLEAARETARMVQASGGEAFAFRCDVSRPQAVYETAEQVKREVGPVDILVNNAGVVTGKRLLDCPDHMIEKTFQVNAMAHFWTCKAFLPDMMSRNHGHLVSIASMAGQSGVVRLTDYCASKFAAVGFEESLRFELFADGHTGIHSTVICPYFVNTGMFDGAQPGLFAMMTPEYVADQIVASVLVNQEVVLLPKSFNVLMVLRAMFSSRVVREVLAQVNISSSMEDFKRRSSTEQHAHSDFTGELKCYDETKVKGL